MTTKKAKKVEKTETEILRPDVEVAGFKIRPWSFDQFFDVLPMFVRGAEILKDSKISLESLEKLGREDPKKIVATLSAFRPIIPDVVALTLGMKQEEVRKLDFDKVISITLVILIQNAERIKNFSGLSKTAIQSLVMS